MPDMEHYLFVMKIIKFSYSFKVHEIFNPQTRKNPS